MSNIRAKLYCLIHGHRPSKVRGYYDKPVSGAICLNNCGKTF